MKKLFFAALLFAAPIFMHSQVKQIVVEEVDNGGNVKGRTYRVYAEMTNIKDQVYVLFGDSVNKLEVKSTKPFYQCSYGGSLSKESNRKQATENPQLRYDSWITIGAVDNYDNNVQVLNLDLTNFETKGGAISIPKDGAWFCVPTDKQAYCGENKRVLLMQLTTEGNITGLLNIMGKTAEGTPYTKYGLKFSSGKN
ncbi:MAG: hypothetical protein IPP69_09500 [Flavobacteriales bacterium]|nr:hypothetical protein [Flavobacteriales bacterium]